MNQDLTPETIGEQLHVCKTCGNSFKGKFCNECGEKVVSQHERTFIHFLHEIFHALTHADGKIWRNLKLLIKNPGQISKTIAGGSRVRLMPPVSMFFVANLIYFLVPMFQTFSTTLHNQIHGTVYERMALERVQRKMKSNQLTFEELAEKYNKKTPGVSKLILIVIIPFLAIAYMLLHFRSRKFFADHVLMALEFMTYTLFYNIIFFGGLMQIVVFGFWIFKVEVPVFLANETMFIVPVVLLSTIYFVYRAERTFYEQKILWSILKTISFLFLFVWVIYLYRFILFQITMTLI